MHVLQAFLIGLLIGLVIATTLVVIVPQAIIPGDKDLWKCTKYTNLTKEPITQKCTQWSEVKYYEAL